MVADDREKIQEIVDAAPEQLKYAIWDKLTGANRLKDAQREQYKRNYERSEKSSRRTRRDKELTSDEIATWFSAFKSMLICSKCDESDPSCLVFHHVDPATKKATVASMVRSKSSKQEILNEIAKCVILCSNCHLKLHRDTRRDSESSGEEIV